MRLDLILLVALAGPSLAVPCRMKSYHSFRRSWSSASTRLDSVLADLPTIYRGGGTVPPGAVAFTTSTVVVSGASSSDNDALATSTASTGLVDSSTSTSTATVTSIASANPIASSSDEVDSSSASISAASSAINPRATTTTTTITTTKPASIAEATPAFTTEDHHDHEADPSDHEPGTSFHAKDTTDHDFDSQDHELDTIGKSKLLPRHGEEKKEIWLLKDREDAVTYHEEHSKKLRKVAHKMGKVLDAHIKSWENASLKMEKMKNGREEAEEELREKKVALFCASLLAKQAFRYARTQQKYLDDAKEELERVQREKAAKDVKNLSPEEILRKENFGKHASSHQRKKRSESKVHGEHKDHKKHKDQHEEEKEDRKHKDNEKHKDTQKHDKEDKKTDSEKEAADKLALEEYEDQLYGKIGDQLKEMLGKKGHHKGHQSHIKGEEKPLYLITKQIKVYKCHEQENCKYKYDPEDEEEKVEQVDGKEHGEKKDKKKKHHKENKVEEDVKEEAKKETEKEKEEEEEDAENEREAPLLAGGDEAEQLKRVQQLYMQYRHMIVQAIRKDLDPMLKNDQFPEDTEMAAQHKVGNEKEQRERLSDLYMGFRHMLIPKFQKMLDPILHEDHQKAN
ncbi:hypothetical protein IL306_010232 [Fusarium sp. DS 682]|nr:hypothetical protein IL306_010232 [Fusarium sp. DS 682]